MPLKFSHALNLSPLQYSFNLLSQLKARAMHTFDISLSLSLILQALSRILSHTRAPTLADPQTITFYALFLPLSHKNIIIIFFLPSLPPFVL